MYFGFIARMLSFCHDSFDYILFTLQLISIGNALHYKDCINLIFRNFFLNSSHLEEFHIL